MQDCPNCGEANPDEAVMCWACYTPLSNVGVANEAGEEGAISINIAQALRWLPLIGGSALILYGLARRSRSGLGGALLGGGLIYLSMKQQQPIPDVAEDEAPIVRIVNTILMYAIKDNASEIHIEPKIRGVQIFYRVDGELREQMKVPKYVLKPLVQRIKIMSDLDILQRGTSQHGRIRFKRFDRPYALHVTTSPTEFGERIVMSFEEATEPSENQVTWEIPHE